MANSYFPNTPRAPLATAAAPCVDGKLSTDWRSARALLIDWLRANGDHFIKEGATEEPTECYGAMRGDRILVLPDVLTRFLNERGFASAVTASNLAEHGFFIRPNKGKGVARMETFKGIQRRMYVIEIAELDEPTPAPKTERADEKAAAPTYQEPNLPVTIEGVSVYLDGEGVPHLNLVDVAIGLGFARVEIKGCTEYKSILWHRVRSYLRDINFRTDVCESCNDADLGAMYIPESVFYRLAMRANSAAAQAFQNKIATEILPSIRKHGAYMTPATIEKVLLNPDFIINLAKKLKAEQEKNAALMKANEELTAARAELEQQIKEMAPKSAYCNTILQHADLVTVTAISKDYGMSAVTFNRMLHDLRIQYKSGILWVLYQEYAKHGYTQTKTFLHDGKAVTHTYWTQKGRLFLYLMLKRNGILPMIERNK